MYMHICPTREYKRSKSFFQRRFNGPTILGYLNQPFVERRLRKSVVESHLLVKAPAVMKDVASFTDAEEL